MDILPGLYSPRNLTTAHLTAFTQPRSPIQLTQRKLHEMHRVESLLQVPTRMHARLKTSLTPLKLPERRHGCVKKLAWLAMRLAPLLALLVHTNRCCWCVFISLLALGEAKLTNEHLLLLLLLQERMPAARVFLHSQLSQHWCSIAAAERRNPALVEPCCRLPPPPATAGGALQKRALWVELSRGRGRSPNISVPSHTLRARASMSAPMRSCSTAYCCCGWCRSSSLRRQPGMSTGRE